MVVVAIEDRRAGDRWERERAEEGLRIGRGGSDCVVDRWPHARRWLGTALHPCF